MWKRIVRIINITPVRSSQSVVMFAIFFIRSSNFVRLKYCFSFSKCKILWHKYEPRITGQINRFNSILITLNAFEALVTNSYLLRKSSRSKRIVSHKWSWTNERTLSVSISFWIINSLAPRMHCMILSSFLWFRVKVSNTSNQRLQTKIRNTWLTSQLKFFGIYLFILFAVILQNENILCLNDSEQLKYEWCKVNSYIQTWHCGSPKIKTLNSFVDLNDEREKKNDRKMCGVLQIVFFKTKEK